ncbi:MAG: hypothetical protein WCG95_04965 [bacterium]
MENMVGQAQNVQVPNYSGVNIQIFNPSVAAPGANVPASSINATNYATMPAYPQNYYTQNFSQPPIPAPIEPQTSEPTKKKTEKREIVQLTDDYIKTLEGYLNNSNKEVRLMGAKEVLSRLQEDDSRKNDVGLNALVNKMLQDPHQPIKFIAMAALESRVANGNDTSKTLLQSIQQQKTAYGEDSLKASNILLKMSGNTVKKEFEVQEKPEKESKKA